MSTTEMSDHPGYTTNIIHSGPSSVQTFKSPVCDSGVVCLGFRADLNLLDYTERL